jgi:hypothetical protein
MLGFMARIRADANLHSFAHPILLAWQSELCCLRKGNAQQGGYDAMPMRRTIDISLACSVTSACGVATASEESTTAYPGDSTGVPPGKRRNANR